MSYDAAGNLTTDTYTGVGNRTYDAENRMTTAADNTGQTSRYTYNAEGKRVRRQVASSQEDWLIYGIDGELLAEYQAGASPSAPEKEYGYRNGQLLVTATGRFNVALASNGAVATASTAHTCCGFSTIGAINGNNRGPWGNGEGWNDATPDSVPDWIQVDFAGSKTIDEIDVFSLHDDAYVQNTPTETQTFTLYGLLAFDVQYWNGSSWVTVPGGSVTGNNKVWRKFTFAAITTSKIRVWINQVPDSWSRVVEIQAFGVSSSGEKVQWLVPDHPGTPRIIVDQTGTLASVKRHDYLPFGEELFAPVGGRTAAQGYASGDAVRQQFTQKERDLETGLDYFEARYFASTQGRFTTVDPFAGSGRAPTPQSWNRYAYVLNNPLRLLDPTGLIDLETTEQERAKQVVKPLEDKVIEQRLTEIRMNATPLAPGEISKPTSVEVIKGEQIKLDNATVQTPTNEFDVQYGYMQTVALVVLDQRKNIIVRPDLNVTEFATPDKNSPDAKLLYEANRSETTNGVQIEQQPNGAFYDVQLRSLDPNRRLMDIKTNQDAVVKSGNTNLFMVQKNQVRMDDANRTITFTQGVTLPQKRAIEK
jgi:RHS repeat-associated protein